VITAVIYLLILFSLIGLLTWGGITLVDQAQNLVAFLQNAANGVPDFIASIAANPIHIGTLTIDLSQVSLLNAVNPILGVIQPILGQAGTIVGSLATGAAGIVGWLFLSLLLSYFIVSETRGEPGRLINLKIPGYQEDITRLSVELSKIWNAFLRGQLLVFLTVVIIYTILLTIMGVHYAFGLALVAGFARFLPYIGGLISWVTYFLVSLTQGTTIFGLTSLNYALMVVIIAWLTDTIIDNLISPRIFSNALKIHPAAVLVTALLGYSIMGITGMILAAPVLATLKLFFDYVIHKMLDMDPFAGMEHLEPPPPLQYQIKHTVMNVLNFLKSNGRRVYRWLVQQGQAASKIKIRR
jgi:predicted PurR-regulated permease PerM